MVVPHDDDEGDAVELMTLVMPKKSAVDKCISLQSWLINSMMIRMVMRTMM